ncbi:hypothetical protein VTO42DRAFT_1797 [Malbranchea cinnamomea]
MDGERGAQRRRIPIGRFEWLFERGCGRGGFCCLCLHTGSTPAIVAECSLTASSLPQRSLEYVTGGRNRTFLDFPLGLRIATEHLEQEYLLLELLSEGQLRDRPSCLSDGAWSSYRTVIHGILLLYKDSIFSIKKYRICTLRTKKKCMIKGSKMYKREKKEHGSRNSNIAPSL